MFMGATMLNITMYIVATSLNMTVYVGSTTTLPIVLNRDLGLIDHFRLQSTDDLVKITELARDR